MMLITTDISEIHEAQIREAAPYKGTGHTSWTLRRVFYYLASQEEELRQRGTAADTDYADLVEELLQGAMEAAKSGDLV